MPNFEKFRFIYKRKFYAGKYLIKYQSFKNGSRFYSLKCYFILVCMYICETSCGWTKWSALLWPFSCLCTRFMSLCPPQGVRTQPLNTTSHLYRKQAQNWVELEVAPYAVCKKIKNLGFCDFKCSFCSTQVHIIFYQNMFKSGIMQIYVWFVIMWMWTLKFNFNW